MAKIGAKQQRFVEEYLIDLNATQAAIRAGYSKNGAGQTAANLLKNTKIQIALQQAMKECSKRTGITIDRVVEEIAKIAFVNAAEAFEFGPDGVTLRNKDELPPELLPAIAEISETKTENGGTIRLKFHPKSTSLDQLMKHLGGYAPEQHQHSGTIVTAAVTRAEMKAGLQEIFNNVARNSAKEPTGSN